MRCINCGTENPDKMRFCNECGFPIEDTSAHTSVDASQSLTATAPTSGHEQQIPSGRQPSQGLSDRGLVAQPRNESVGASSHDTETIFCTECGTANSFYSLWCDKCNASMSPSRYHITQGSSPSASSTDDVPMWKKAIIVPYLLLMFGSGGVLLADGATYGMLGHGFLGLGGYVIFGSVFLVTFGIYKLADRLPRSTRKAMKEASKRRRLGQINSQPSALHPSYAPQKSVTGPQFCTACGRALQEGTAFCTNCGNPDNRMQNS